jgi:DNA-binding IclR family transcriptional regulator
MMKNKSLIATIFGYSPQMRILNYLLDFPTNDFTKKEIIQALGMSKQTFYKYFENLEESGIVKVNRAIGKARLYKLDRSNPMIKTITEFERKLSMQMASRQSSMLM